MKWVCNVVFQCFCTFRPLTPRLIMVLTMLSGAAVRAVRDRQASQRAVANRKPAVRVGRCPSPFGKVSLVNWLAEPAACQFLLSIVVRIINWRLHVLPVLYYCKSDERRKDAEKDRFESRIKEVQRETEIIKETLQRNRREVLSHTLGDLSAEESQRLR